jgi:tripartite ATP-independent transporter DctM subunit
MTFAQVGILGCALLLALLMSSMPVAFAMMAAGFIGFAVLRNPTAAMSLLTNDLYDKFQDHNLTVIPLFVLMGQVAFHSGISRRLFNTAYTWMGALRGGLAMATIGACTGFGAICGSGPATAATIAAVALPELKRYKYSMELGAGAVAAGGSLGMLIPPSVVFIVYGIMTEQSVGSLFLAGIMPGLMIAGLFCLTIYLSCLRKPSLGPAGPSTTMVEKLRSLTGVIETLLLFVLVMGGMFLGLFTPTEAAAVGAFGSILIAVVKRQLSWSGLLRSLQETVRTSCMVMIIVAGATTFGRFLGATGVPNDLAVWLAQLPLPGTVIIGLIILFYLVAGCFVDALALVLLTIPIFQPVVTGLGFDLVWFGVIIVVVTQMGVITPPVGVCAYIVSGIARDISLQTVFKGAMPFLAALIVASVILVAFPKISLWLPDLMAQIQSARAIGAGGAP